VASGHLSAFRVNGLRCSLCDIHRAARYVKYWRM
jgi:hypothetical protein